ncbi:MAG: transcriptional regulator, partial [Cyanobacteria bacterium P01_H01_bin.119]
VSDICTQPAPVTDEELDVTKRDRFELLSAYLDGEVTSDERRQVNGWLETDLNTQCLYQRLLGLRRGLQRLPAPTHERCLDTTVDQIICRVRQRFRLAVMAGAGTVAVFCLGTMSGFFGDRPGGLQFAQFQPSDTGDSPALEVALDQPVIEIPKAATSTAY